MYFLAEYNLSVGNLVYNINMQNDPQYQIKKLDNPTNKQANNMRGLVCNNSPQCTEFPTEWYGTIEFSSDSQRGQNYSDYKGSIVEIYVNKYLEMLKKEFNAPVKSAGLITNDDLVNIFSCSENEYMCPTTYPWLLTTSYWTMTPNGSFAVWYVLSTGDFSSYDFSVGYDQDGVRPVIIISKSEF